MLKHFPVNTDAVVEGTTGAHLRRTQEDHGGWPLLRGGALNVSASVKAYVALRMIGDAAEAPHMARARDTIVAAGEVDRDAVARGVANLHATQMGGGSWPEDSGTGTGFPRVFSLRYHGYPKFFPRCALARYRNVKHSDSRTVMVGV